MLTTTSTGLMGRLETEALTKQSKNLKYLANLPGVWVEKAHQFFSIVALPELGDGKNRKKTDYSDKDNNRNT